MRIIVSVILLAFITVSCGTNKRVYAPPFEEEETETVVVKEIRLDPNNPLIKLKWRTKAIEKKIKIQENIEEIKEIHPFYNCA